MASKTITLLRIDGNPELNAANIQGDDLLLIQHDIGNLNCDYKLKISSLVSVISDSVGSDIRSEISQSMSDFQDEVDTQIETAVTGIRDDMNEALEQMQQDLPGSLVLTDSDFDEIF